MYSEGQIKKLAEEITYKKYIIHNESTKIVQVDYFRNGFETFSKVFIPEEQATIEADRIRLTNYNGVQYSIEGSCLYEKDESVALVTDPEFKGSNYVYAAKNELDVSIMNS